jgi:hypothetical protein
MAALSYKECVDIAFHGYDDLTCELDEIEPVREYVRKLDDQFPYWLFFLSKHFLGLQCLMYCFLLPDLTDAAKARLHPQQLTELLENRWGPALTEIAAFAGLTEEQTQKIERRSVAYFLRGAERSQGS